MLNFLLCPSESVGPREQNGYSQVNHKFLLVVSHKDSTTDGFFSFLANEVPPSVGQRSDGGLAVKETLQTFANTFSVASSDGL